MLPFKIKLTTFIHQTYLDIISPNLYILYFKSFCWYFVVEKPNSRYCFACNQEEKNITLPKNNNQRALYENEKLFGGATTLPSRGASEWIEWYKTKNTLDWTNFIFKIRLISILKTLPLICKFQKHVQAPTPLSIKQKDTHTWYHITMEKMQFLIVFFYRYISNCLGVHYPYKFYYNGKTEIGYFSNCKL